MIGHLFKIFCNIRLPSWRTRALLLLLAILALGGGVLGCHLWALKKYRDAQRALEQRRFGEASADLSFCLKVWPRSAETHLLAARAARLQKDYEEAEKHIDAAYRLDANMEAIRLERVLLKVHRGRMGEVEEEYLQSLVLQDFSPTTPWSSLAWSAALTALANRAGSATSFNYQHPDLPLILEALAQGYMKALRLPQALYTVSLWHALQPDNPEPLLQRGSFQRRLRHFKDADADFRQALALQPEHFEARLLFAGNLLELGDQDQAREQFEYLYQIQPGDAVVLLGLARCIDRIGQTDRAREILQQLVTLHPQQPLPLRERGKVARTEGKLAEAEEWFRKALALEDLDRDTHYNLGLCLQQLGRSEEAKRCFARADEINTALARLEELYDQILIAPNDPEPRCQAGIVYLRLGLQEEGVRWLGSALKEDPGHRGSHEALAECYAHSGQLNLAARHRRLAQQALPTWPP